MWILLKTLSSKYNECANIVRYHHRNVMQINYDFTMGTFYIVIDDQRRNYIGAFDDHPHFEVVINHNT